MRKQDKENWEFGNKLCVGDTEYDGQWVLIKDSKVIAHGNDPEIFTKCQVCNICKLSMFYDENHAMR